MADTTQTDAELDGDQTILKPKEAKGWLDLIKTSEVVFQDWQAKCDNIDKMYANLEKLASTTREREFQLFNANIAVLGPSIYSRPPVPVVTPRFKDRRPIARTASEVLERTCIVTNEDEDIDDVMLELRNDLTVNSRGVVWQRLDEDEGYPCACVDHVGRRDFLHDPARIWKEVDWVAKRSWLTRSDARKRFYKTSGNEYQNATYTVRKKQDDGYKEGDKRLKAGFWELWSKSSDCVVWVAEGCEKVLDEGEPHLDLEDFFPCPKPAYGTLQRGTLIPVPDMLFYKDQLEEINEITGRIAALTESLRVKGFYPAGAGHVSDAIEAAMKNTQNNTILIPVPDWAMMGGVSPKDMIVWIPIEQIALVVKELIELRKQLIDDVYQITGLSDIMRGSTVASETLGAQKLKSQYGSVRIRDRQGELVRIARDMTRITAEIIAENYDQKTIVEMSQMQLPTNAEIKGQIVQLQRQGQQIESQIQQAKQNPQIMQMAQQDPQKAQEVEQQAQQQLQAITGQIEKLGQTVTIDQVMKFLRDNKMRCFTLDIETDSTIQPDEDAAKQRATEYLQAMSTVLQQAVGAISTTPQIAPVVSEMVIFANKQFRVGRSMEQTIEEFADQMKQMAQAPRPDPNAAQMQADQAKLQADQQTKQSEIQAKGQSEQAKIAADQQVKQADIASKEKIALDSNLLEKHKIDTAAADNKSKLDLETVKALLTSLTALEVAHISAKSDVDSIIVTKQLEKELGIQDHANALELQGQAQDAQAAAAANDTATNGAAPAPPDLASVLQEQLAAHQQQNMTTQQALLATLQNLHKTMAAPRQVTTPEGRVFTSQAVQ